ncbi:hypothetical protein [Jejuia spongiicola]|uniref:Uncharacterized protein n=1 Tax=Jejuia spongiicola TaxID=2942207 RepID=A0ABT0Q9H2_9FLAO|nr:hypothetical protein [Jejuia spongiicola]MCL6293606.1 hypothetical protein [Jejuia spongiicola]
MLKNIASIFFSVVFLLFTVAPTIIYMVDDSIDVSVFYSSSEEEEKGHEKNKDTEVLFSESIDNDFVFDSKKTNNNLGYCYKKYPKTHLNLISPPPELHIL